MKIAYILVVTLVLIFDYIGLSSQVKSRNAPPETLRGLRPSSFTIPPNKVLYYYIESNIVLARFGDFSPRVLRRPMPRRVCKQFEVGKLYQVQKNPAGEIFGIYTDSMNLRRILVEEDGVLVMGTISMKAPYNTRKLTEEEESFLQSNLNDVYCN